jgi:adenine deaminase
MIDVAAGRTRAELVLKNASVVNVFSGDILEGDVAIHQGYVAGIGKYVGSKTVDLKGKFVVPSFMDGHVHVESSMVMPIQYARAVVPHGTGAVVADPHEIANVLGLEGIMYMSKSMRGGPLEFYIMLPSCVPSTDLETNGVALDFLDIKPLLSEHYVLGLAEAMNYQGVVYRDPDILEKIRVTLNTGKKIDGHAPDLAGMDLNAYAAARITSEHESYTLEEAQTKLAVGMHIHIREGSTAKNLKDLAPLIQPHTSMFCSFVSDDRNTAIRVATISTARHYGLQYRGAVVPGYHADIAVLDNLKNIKVEMVYKNGIVVASKGKLVWDVGEQEPPRLRRSVNISWLDPEDFQVKARGDRMNVIGIIPDQIITKHLVEETKVKDGLAVPDVDRDIAKISIIERHNASDVTAIGFVKGLGLKEGAMVSSIAHDSHNIVAVATSDRDLIAAAVQIVRMQGGLAIVRDEKTLNEPFMTMAFLSLPVIPKLKITDKGLVDVDRFRFIDLFDTPK